MMKRFDEEEKRKRAHRRYDYQHRHQAIKNYSNFLGARVNGVVSSHTGLKEFVLKSPWFPSLLEGMLSNMLRDAVQIDTRLNNLSDYESLTMGRSFALALFDRPTADAAVDVFVNEYPALVALSKKERWFVPMSLAIGQRKLEQAHWGLTLKVGIGAFLSVADVGTDAFALTSFIQRGNTGFATAVAATILTNMAVQILTTFVNRRNQTVNRNWLVLRECILILSGMKPVADAFRVVSGFKAQSGELFEPMVEMNISRITENVLETIPSSLIQVSAYLLSENRRLMPLVSIFVSIATIAFCSTSMAFDYDLDPTRRVKNPEFYGYVPNRSKPRAAVFVLMFFFTACHVSIRLLGVALLAVINPILAVGILGADSLLYLTLKLARDDFRYWLNVSGVMSMIVSICWRMIGKIFVDFTALVHFR